MNATEALAAVERWLHVPVLGGLSAAQWLVALAAAALAWLTMTLALGLARRRLARLAGRTANGVDDLVVEVLAGTQGWLLALVALLIGLGLLDLPERWAARVGQLWFIALALQLALWLNRLVTVLLRRHVGRHAAAGAASTAASASETLLSWGLRTLLWSVVALAMLANLGVNITAFVASLGVGGIAVALAVQNILGDLFASLAIALDKPFEVGDFIVLGAVAGTVENVGLKTTRIRSLGGEQIVMSNTELLKQTVSNYKRLAERRIVFTFGIDYATPPTLVERVPAIVREAVDASPRLRFDRAHFKGFGENWLDFEAVYIVLAPDYNLYMDEQQRINLALLRSFEAEGIAFAFPTRTVRVVGGGAGQAIG